MDTIWVLGDQLRADTGALAGRTPGSCRVLLVISEAKLASKRWHVQRLHLVVSAMRHFAAELAEAGHLVDLRHAPTMADGVRAHVADHEPDRVLAMEPMSWDGLALFERLGVETVANDQFLCHWRDFAAWRADRKRLVMEDFYRWQRTRLDILMESDGSPVGGAWNFDHDNREPPPTDGRAWPPITRFDPTTIDDEVRSSFEGLDVWGDEPDGTWPVTRTQALQRLDDFINHALPVFGPHEDAMVRTEWKLAHSVLAASMNLGLLHPGEIAEAAETAYREGRVPIASAEGFIRQVIGWREYVWGVFWLWMPDYRHANTLGATRPVPVAFTDGRTGMACVAAAHGHLRAHGYTHHIERLMVFGNLALTAGVDPAAMVEWMWASFVDGAEWVMLPNVIGMALHADGGRMATKPYASGGAYINKMSDSCKGCRYDPKKRTGEAACPFTTLYWDFLARNEEALAGNHRMARQLAGMRRLADLDETRARAAEVLELLDAGSL